MSDVTDIDRLGYVHEALLYRTEQELLDVAVPFLEEGRDAGEGTVVAVGPERSELVRDAVDHPDDLIFDTDVGAYLTPAGTIKQYLDLFASLLAGGATRIRVLGEVPLPGPGRPWHAWARYEAACNRAFRDLPVWGLCTYDLRVAPAEVLRDVHCTHARLATGGDHVRNARYQDPTTWLRERGDPPADPLEATMPLAELRDPWPHEARLAVEPFCRHLPPSTRADLATAVSELVANARMHGAPPVVTRVWADRDRVVVTVRDAGTGPEDPFAGLLPPRRRIGDGGLGLWIAHQLCPDVTMTRSPDGFQVRTVATQPGAG